MSRARGALAAALLVLSACVDPGTPSSGVPTLDDAGADGFAAVSVGLSHSCALTLDGAAYCWGSNEFGQLGVAANTSTCLRADRRVPCQRAPRPVLGGLKFARISAGGSHTCGLALNARVYCWGDNLRGQLGDPALRQALQPAPIVNTALFVDVAAGEEHTCAVRSDDVIMCWGANIHGELGVGSVGTGVAIPVAAQTNLRFASVAAGAQRTCARVADGTAYCWGARWVLRTDDGAEVIASQSQPLRVAVTPTFQALSVGGGTTCGLAVDLAAYCWESNPTGALGNATTTGSITPQLVATGERFVALGVGASHACGVSDTGAAWCWGAAGSGQLGVSSSRISARCGRDHVPCVLSPIKVSGWRVFSGISVGLGEHVCGITISTNVYCWGEGAMGQLGDGRVNANWSPTKVIAP